MAPSDVIELDGRTGEGGGQLVRIAIALASVVSKPVKITNIRGKRPGPRGGGLKSQHVTSIEWLAQATGADVTGLEVGSKTLEFRPNRGPNNLLERNVKIRAASAAASSLLIFQAVFPFLLFAGNENDEPVELTISGGTNVSFSLSYEYLDQVLLPMLEEWFGISVERKLLERGWSAGPASRGSIWFKIQPLHSGEKLRLKNEALGLGTRPMDFEVKSVDATVITPAEMHVELETALRDDLEKLFPGAVVYFRQHEESNHAARIYVLLVAKSVTLRWGRDHLYAAKRKGKTTKELSAEISSTVTNDLYGEVSTGGVVDEYLQDQLVVFQALAAGRTSFPRSKSGALILRDEQDGATRQMEEEMDELSIGEDLKKDKTGKPFGDSQTDSSHTQTARWVTAEVLEPTVTWFNKGRVCEGVGLSSGKDTFIVLADHATSHELLNKRSLNYSHRPSMPMASDLLYKGDHMLLRPFDDKYKAHRRNMGPLFTKPASQMVAPLLDMESLASLRQLLDFCDGSEKARLDAREYVKHVKDQSRLLDGYCAVLMALHRFTASMSYMLLYGFRIETGRESELTNAHLIEKRFVEAMKPGVWPCDVLPALNNLPGWLAPWKRTAERWYEFERDHHMKSIAKARETRSWNWTKALMGNKAARGLSEVSLAYDVGVLNNAGLDTTVQTLEMFVMAAVANPEKMKIAQEELDRVVGRDRLPVLEDTVNLPYLSAVIEEVLRWRPIIPGGIPHSNLQEDSFMGYRIPKGCIVIPNSWSINMDEKVYKDAHLFLPERWLENPTLPDQVTFGFGRRVCLGEQIARSALLLMASRLLWAFEMKKELDGAGHEIEVDTLDLTDYIIIRPNPFPLRLALRHGTVRQVVDAAWGKVEKDPDTLMDQMGGYFKDRMT